jgi:hypothetical protein
LPLLRTKKEVFDWLEQGRKTIDVRKGIAHRGEFAHFQSGPHSLRLKIVKTETGRLTEVMYRDNYRLVIPTARNLDDAIVYLRGIYGSYDGVFTAYYVEPLKG